MGLDVVSLDHASLTRSRSPSVESTVPDEKQETTEQEDLTSTLNRIQQERYRHEEDPELLSPSEERLVQRLNEERGRGAPVSLFQRAGDIVSDIVGGDGGGGGGAIAGAVLLMLLVSAMPTHERGGGY